jgi:hypothetical protein
MPLPRSAPQRVPAAFIRTIVAVLPKNVSLEGQISETQSCLRLPASDAVFERVMRDMRNNEAQEAEKEGRSEPSREQDQPRH